VTSETALAASKLEVVKSEESNRQLRQRIDALTAETARLKAKLAKRTWWGRLKAKFSGVQVTIIVKEEGKNEVAKIEN